MSVTYYYSIARTTGSANPSVTRVALEDSCSWGSLSWERPLGSQLVQFFSDDHTSFTVCLWSNMSAGIALYHLSGSSKKLLVSEEQNPVERFCVLSKCSHVSLLLEADSSMATLVSSIEYKYQHNLDERK